MQNKSLETVTKAIIDVLNELDLDELDKLELMINLMKFLDINNYEENIKILRGGRR